MNGIFRAGPFIMLKIVAVWREKFVRFCRLLNWEPGNWKIENGNAKNRNAARARRAPSPLGRVDSRFSVFEFRISSFGETKPKQSHGLNALIAKEIG